MGRGRRGRWRYFSVVHITNEEGIVVFSLAVRKHPPYQKEAP
jgi:hypothetical protein